LPAGAGLFLWIDLRPLLAFADGESPTKRGSDAWEHCVGVEEHKLSEAEAKAERALYMRLINEFGLLLTPGASMRAEEPGARYIHLFIELCICICIYMYIYVNVYISPRPRRSARSTCG